MVAGRCWTTRTSPALLHATLAGVSLRDAVLGGARLIGTRVTLAQLSVANWTGVIAEKIQANAFEDLERAFNEAMSDGE